MPSYYQKKARAIDYFLGERIFEEHDQLKKDLQKFKMEKIDLTGDNKMLWITVRIPTAVHYGRH